MVLLAKSVYYKCLKIKKNIHRIKNVKKHVFYRKIKHIKYVLNNYDLNHLMHVVIFIFLFYIFAVCVLYVNCANSRLSA